MTAFNSQIDSGQGTVTGFTQIIADELDVLSSSITMVTGDTARVANNGSIGSASGIINNSQPLRYAAAEARLALLTLASSEARRARESADGLERRRLGRRRTATYGELIGGQAVQRSAPPDQRARQPGPLRRSRLRVG